MFISKLKPIRLTHLWENELHYLLENVLSEIKATFINSVSFNTQIIVCFQNAQ